MLGQGAFSSAPGSNVGGSGVTGSSDSSLTIAGSDAIINQAFAPTWTGAHIWQTSDAGTTNVPVQMTAQHRSSGTPAAGFGVGVALKLDSSAKNLRSAVELDAVWSTATDTTEVSSLAVKTMLAGVATEVFRIGTGAALPDSDVSFSLGRALLDQRVTDRAYFSHRDMTSSTQYALVQLAGGETRVNAGATALRLRFTDTSRIDIDGTGIGFFAATPVAKQTGPALTVTNSITAGGTDGTFTDWTNLTTYSTDAAAIRNAVYQVGRIAKFCSDALRAYGLLT